MRVNIAADPAEMPMLFRHFVAITSWEPWRARLAALNLQVKENPLLETLFAERHSLELEIERLHQRISLGLKISLPKTYRAYAAQGFVAMVARVYDRLSSGGQRRLAGMLRSGLDGEYGLASFQHEMTVAAHLISRDFDVTFSDIEGDSRVDLLAAKDGLEVEVECKTHSADIGRKVHRRRIYQLGKLILPMMDRALERSGGQLAQIKVPKRLDGSDQQLRDISERVAQSLGEGVSVQGHEPCAVDYEVFPLASSPFETSNPSAMDMEVARRYLEERRGYPVGHVLMLFRPNRGVVVVTVESLQPDRVMHGLVRQLKRLVSEQMTGPRPGVICVKFLDITEDEMLELAEGDRAGDASSLQRATSMLLDREDWRHVHSVAYITPGHLVRRSTEGMSATTTLVVESGPAYVFTNPHHELTSDPRLKIF